MTKVVGIDIERGSDSCLVATIKFKHSDGELDDFIEHDMDKIYEYQREYMCMWSTFAKTDYDKIERDYEEFVKVGKYKRF